MAHAEICPICHGEGKVVSKDESRYPKGTLVTCHGCGGKGWVEVKDE